jgi:hypothetical protein
MPEEAVLVRRVTARRSSELMAIYGLASPCYLAGVATGLCRNKQHVRTGVSSVARVVGGAKFSGHIRWADTAPDGVEVDSLPGARAAVVM